MLCIELKDKIDALPGPANILEKHMKDPARVHSAKMWNISMRLLSIPDSKFSDTPLGETRTKKWALLMQDDLNWALETAEKALRCIL